MKLLLHASISLTHTHIYTHHLCATSLRCYATCRQCIVHTGFVPAWSGCQHWKNFMAIVAMCAMSRSSNRSGRVQTRLSMFHPSRDGQTTANSSPKSTTGSIIGTTVSPVLPNGRPSIVSAGAGSAAGSVIMTSSLSPANQVGAYSINVTQPVSSGPTMTSATPTAAAAVAASSPVPNSLSPGVDPSPRRGSTLEEKMSLMSQRLNKDREKAVREPKSPRHFSFL